MLGFKLNHVSKRGHWRHSADHTNRHVFFQDFLAIMISCHFCWPDDQWPPWYQASWGQHGAHLGPTGPRWAPCWPHEHCYLGILWNLRQAAFRVSMMITFFCQWWILIGTCTWLTASRAGIGINGSLLNSLAPGRCGCNFESEHL